MMQLPRTLAALLFLAFVVGCGAVREVPPDDDTPIGDDVDDPPDAGVTPMPDAAIEPMPDAPVEPTPDAPVEPTPDAPPPPPPDAPPPPECTTAAQCGGATPFCVDEHCVECNTDHACPAAEPVCSAVDHTCGGCQGDADCSGFPTAGSCAPSGACVECVNNGDCGGGTPYCVANHCEECNGDAACSVSEPVCSAASYTCGGCTVDADCSAYPGLTNCGPGGACVECANNGDCGGTTPYCVANQCEECNGDAACNASEPVCSAASYTCGGCAIDADCGAYASTPNCDPGGACVECVNNADCSGTSPVCEGAECRACQSGSECASGECHLDTGACYTAAELIYLSPSGSDTNACTKTAKCKTFDRVLEVLTATKHTITLAPGTYEGAIDSFGYANTHFPLPVELLGHGATYLGGAFFPPGTNAVVDLVVDNGYIGSLNCANGSTCRYERVTTNAALFGAGAHTLVDFHSSNVFQVTGPLTIRRSTFIGVGTSTTNGYFTATGGFDITNSVFARNPYGVTLSNPPAGQPRRFENNTVVDNGTSAQTNTVLDLKCNTGVTGSFRNNIVWSSFPPGTGSSVTSGCPLTYSLVYTGTSSAYPGVGNLLGNPAFVRLWPSGSLPADFHLTSASVARDTADPANPLADDMDGDSRPQGSRADMGADEYVP